MFTSRNFMSPVARRGFTLVELLVVIGIIALLISILLPALNRARESAMSVVCMANLRSLGQAVHLYAHHNNGSMPIGFWNGQRPGQPASSGTHWVLLLQNTMNSSHGADWNSAAGSGANVAKIREAFICPTAPGEFQKNVNVSGVTSYLSHPRLIPWVDLNGNWPQDNVTGTPRPFRPYKLAGVRRASEIAMVFDGSVQLDAATGVWVPAWDIPVGISLDARGVMNGPPNGTYMTDQYPTGAPTWNSPNAAINFDPQAGGPLNSDTAGNPHQIRFRHMYDRRANVLMVDGHVETFDFRDGTNNAMRRANINVNSN